MYRCRVCQHEEKAWARIERHVDEQHGSGRIEIILPKTDEKAKR